MDEPRMHLILRSYGGENRKHRPAYYSKLLTLTSFVRAAQAVPNGDIIFVNDGPIPGDRLTIMERFGEVVWTPSGPIGMRGSYLHALDLTHRRTWPDTDLVAFNEDDYLFTEHAFTAIREAHHVIPEASYFTVYASPPDYTDPHVRRQYSLPRDWRPRPDVDVAGTRWFHHPSTTSTFAGRVGAVRADRAVFRHCMYPFRRRFLDHETCLIYQGHVPYRGTEIITGLPDDVVWSARELARTAFLVPFRIALDVHAALRHEPHYLYGATPNEATHLENPVVSPDRDWTAVGREVAQWAEEAGLRQAATRLRASLR